MEELLTQTNQAALKFLSQKSPSQLFKIIVDEGIRLTGAQYGSIFLLQDDKLSNVYSSSPSFEKLSVRKNGFTYTAFKTNKPMLIAGEKVNNIHKEIRETNIKSILLIPLSYENNSIGIL